MAVANERLNSERRLPSEPQLKRFYVNTVGMYPMVVPTNDFSAMLTGYLNRVISAAIVGNYDFVYPCQ
jgi:nitrate reductase NapE component